MNKKLSGILGIVLSIVILVYFETFAYKLFDLVGINVLSFSSTIKIIIDIVIKLVMCFIIYIIYKRDFRSRRGNDNIVKTLLVFVVSLVSIVVGMYLFGYVVDFIGDIFDVTVLENNFYNIFDKNLNFELVVKIISDYIVIPYLYCSIIILSVDKFARRTDTCIILSGVLASVIHALTLSGTLGFVIVNSLSMFVLFGILAFIYRKRFSIYFIIALYSFYLISNVFVLNYIGW